jgi:hypothetical protein
LRQWARAHGCILMTPEDHFVLRERLSLAVAMAKEDADGLAIGEAIECLLDDLENEWRVSLQ